MTKLNVSRNLAGAATVAAIPIAAPQCACPGAESAAAWGPSPRPRPKKWSASTVTAVVFALVGSATSMSSPRRHRPVSTSGPAGPGAHLPGSRLLTSLQCRSCDPSAPPADGSFCRRLTQSDKASLRESLPKCVPRRSNCLGSPPRDLPGRHVYERSVNLARAESPECPDCCSSAEPARPEHTWGPRRFFAAHSIPERIRSTRRMLADPAHAAHWPPM
jgi:hypothetical protein